MKTLFIKASILLFVGVVFTAKSQNTLIPFNDIIGDVIDSTEQQKYLLFSDLIDSTVQYSEIHKEQNDYFLKLFTKKDSSQVKIPYEDLVYYRKLVEKMDTYAENLTQGDTSQEKSVLIVNQEEHEVSAPLTNEELNEKMRKEARRFQIMRSEANRQGLQGQARQNYYDTGGTIFISK